MITKLASLSIQCQSYIENSKILKLIYPVAIESGNPHTVIQLFRSLMKTVAYFSRFMRCTRFANLVDSVSRRRSHALRFLGLLGLLVLQPFSIALAQNAFEKGRAFFEQRARESETHQAQPEYINQAIDAFEQAIAEEVEIQKSAEYLLRAYYFKGMFTGLPKDAQKEIYDKGRDLGEKMTEKYPDSVPVKFWYAANLGRWAKVFGFVNAATNGIAGKVRQLSKQIIKLDPAYQGGGGYRILAQVNFYSPNIPLLMGWPSDKKALNLIEKALEIAPDHPTNRMLYAQLLLEFDRGQDAKKELQGILDLEPRPDYLIEDRYVQYRSRQLLEEKF